MALPLALGLMMDKSLAVVIDDDPEIAKILAACLDIKTIGYSSPSEIGEGLAPVICFLDVHLGDAGNGLEHIVPLRKQWSNTALIVITADHRDDLLGEALAAGANDFIRKPLNIAEVTARARARISEARVRQARENVEVHDFMFNYRLRRIERREEEAFLSPLGAELLQILIEAGSDLVKKDTLLRRLWGGRVVSGNSLDQRLLEIREALAKISSSRTIVVSYGKGVTLGTATKESSKK